MFITQFSTHQPLRLIYSNFIFNQFNQLYKDIMMIQQHAYCQTNSIPYNVLKNPRKWELTQYGKQLKNMKSRLDEFTEITVMSYNVLAQYLIHSNMYLYDTCKPEYLGWNYRKANLLAEIKDLKADILCLQEIQADHYLTFFYPELLKLGYEGVYKKRTRTKMDGCATFYKTDMFELETARSVEYLKPKDVCQLLDRDNVALILILKLKKYYTTTTTTNNEKYGGSKNKNSTSTAEWPYNNNKKQAKQSTTKIDNEKINALQQPSSVKAVKEDYYFPPYNSCCTRSTDTDKQADLLNNEEKPKKKLCIANTHLLFNPKRSDIKLVQSHILMAEIDKLSRTTTKNSSSSYVNADKTNHSNNTPTATTTQQHIPVILCGDFNLTPTSPIYHQFFRPYESKIYDPEAIFQEFVADNLNTNTNNRTFSNHQGGRTVSSQSGGASIRFLPPWDLWSIMRSLHTDEYSTYVTKYKGDEFSTTCDEIVPSKYSKTPVLKEEGNGLDYYYNDQQPSTGFDSILRHRFPLYSVYGHYTRYRYGVSSSSSSTTNNEFSSTLLRKSSDFNLLYVPEITTKNSMTGFTVDYIFYTSSIKDPVDSSLFSATNNASTTTIKPSRTATSLNKLGDSKATDFYKMTTNLKLIARYRLLSDEDVLTKLGGCLPNQYISSDHLCLAAKFALQD